MFMHHSISGHFVSDPAPHKVPTLPRKREKVWNFENNVPGLESVVIFTSHGKKTEKTTNQSGFETISIYHSV